MLSMLAGHKRYTHIAALRCDAVLPELLGMEKIVSEDAVRRGLKAIDEEEGAAWLRRHLDHCVGPLLNEPWNSPLVFKKSTKNGSCPSGVIAASWSHSTRTVPAQLSTSTPAGGPPFTTAD
jgi:hypothetical protein